MGDDDDDDDYSFEWINKKVEKDYVNTYFFTLKHSEQTAYSIG